MRLQVLDKNDSWPEILDKLDEEYKEAKDALNGMYMMLASAPKIFNSLIINSKVELAGELLDVIQVCIGALDKLEDEGINVNKCVKDHNRKLEERGWNFKCGISLTRRRLENAKSPQDPQTEEK